MKKKLAVAATVLTLGIGGLGTVGLASAATNTSSSNGSSIVDRLVSKFGLNKADVQAVFDEEHTEREAERLTRLQEKLATAVSDGDITQAQSDKIVAKYKELQAARDANRDVMQDLSDDERKAKMDEEREAFKTWMDENDIPQEYARLIHMGGHIHGGPRGHMGLEGGSNSSSN